MKKSLKNVNNENAHCRTWNMARKLKITENEKYTLYDVNMARKTEKGGNLERSTVGHGINQEN